MSDKGKESAEPVAFIHPLDIGRRCETTPFRESDEQVKLFTAPPDLLAENARLREALEDIARWPHSGAGEYAKGERDPCGYYHHAYYLMEAEITKARDIARAALKEPK